MRVNVGGTRLFFDVEGSALEPNGPSMREKPTLLLLHGGPGMDHTGYKPLFSQLADICQVVYIDQRGNGRSEGDDPRQWNLDRWGDDVREFCEALDIRRPIVLGTSFGGFVAQSYAARYPDHPAKLVLVSTRAAFNRERQLAAFERNGGLAARDVARRFLDELTDEVAEEFRRVCLPLYTRRPPNPEAGTRPLRRFEVAQHFNDRERQRFDLRGSLRAVRCPVLVIAGDYDPVVPWEDSREMADCLASAQVRFELIPGAGHGIWSDEPEQGIRLVREFILT